MSLADARLRRFSAITWLVGSGVAAVLAFTLVPTLAINPMTGEILFNNPNDYEYRPWEDPDAEELEIVGGEIAGTGDTGYLDLPSTDELILLGPLTEGAEDYTNVYHQLDTAVAIVDERPEYIGLLSETRDQVIFPAASEGRLWFSPRLGDWRASVSRETATPIEGTTASGTGPALLLYDGDALSARFTFEGEGFFSADAISPGSTLDLVRGVDAVDERASWPATDRVVIRIDVDEGIGSWSLTLDEPAASSP